MRFFVYLPFFLIIFEDVISLFVLALKKFGKRNYFRRLPKTYSICKIIIDVIISAISLFIIYVAHSLKSQSSVENAEKTRGFLEYLACLFCCCCYDIEDEDQQPTDYLGEFNNYNLKGDFTSNSAPSKYKPIDTKHK